MGQDLKVPMVDLKKQYQSIRHEVEDALSAVMDDCRFILGENVAAIEKEVAEYCGAAYGLGVNSGTDALTLGLRALGVGEGDEVITTPFTFVATSEVIVSLGAKPVYADINPRTFNLDPKQVESKITPKTKAILPVHLFGQAADVLGMREIADRHGLKLIWDGAQAIGSETHGRAVGAYGDIVTLSFFPTKNLGAAGDGGMVLTNDAELLEKLKYLRFHGNGGAGPYKYVAYCSRLDEIQAAILRVKLPYLDKWTEQRRQNAAAYCELLADTGITLPVEETFNKHSYHQFTIRCADRDKLRDYLASRGISAGTYYAKPIYLEEAYTNLGYSAGETPETERVCGEVLSLPIIPELTEEQLAWVAGSIRSFYEGR